MRSAQRVFLVAFILVLGATLTAQVLPGTKTPSRPQTYGNAAVSYVRIPGSEFLPANSGINYSTFFGVMRYSYDDANPGTFQAPLHLPAGAKIVYLELDFLDDSPSAAVYARLQQCDLNNGCTDHPTAGAGPMDCLLPGYICSGNAAIPGIFYGAVDLSSENIIVDNVNYAYSLSAGSTALSFTTQIVGILIGYVLQVSPAPVTATFTDVPTSDFAFQFIEAFSKAGITVGCDTVGPRFCPDRNVTRREMAVFFAKALGLQFQ